MLATWITDEMKTVALPDKRLDERLRQVLSQLAARPTASIPAACGGRAEMVAAYRFFENENTNFDNVLQPHRDATRQRMAAQPTVILVQDTTEINVTRPEQQVAGAGPLDGVWWRGSAVTSTENEPSRGLKPSGSGCNGCMTLLPAGKFLVLMFKRNP